MPSTVRSEFLGPLKYVSTLFMTSQAPKVLLELLVLPSENRPWTLWSLHWAWKVYLVK